MSNQGGPARGEQGDRGFWPKDLTNRVTKCPILKDCPSQANCFLTLFPSVSFKNYLQSVLSINALSILRGGSRGKGPRPP